MKLNRATTLELGQILKEEFKLELGAKELEKFAYSLVGYFDLLLRVDSRHRFQNSPGVPIDQSSNTKLDKKEVK